MSHKICAIFDLDDTLTECQWRSHLLEPLPGEKKKNWPAFFAACAQDPANERMVEIALGFAKADIHLIVLTGRQETYREMSMGWLTDRGLNPVISEFRPDNSFKPDHALKKAWIERLQAQGYEIVAAFDDRGPNVEVFRELGILSANALDKDEVEAVAAEGLALAEARLAAFNARGTPAKAPAPKGLAAFQRSPG